MSDQPLTAEELDRWRALFAALPGAYQCGYEAGQYEDEQRLRGELDQWLDLREHLKDVIAKAKSFGSSCGYVLENEAVQDA